MIVAQGAVARDRPHPRACTTTAPTTADLLRRHQRLGSDHGLGDAYRAVSQFSKGEYADANNTEDDLAIIQANGLAPRADDHGNTPPTADQLGAKASYAVNGVISTRTDTDFFAIDAARAPPR